MFSPKFICWSLSFQDPQNRTILGARAFKVTVKLKWDRYSEPWSNVTDILTEKGNLYTWERQRGCSYTEETSCEDTGRRRPFASQEEQPREKPHLLTPLCWSLALRTLRWSFVVWATHPWYFVMAALADYYSGCLRFCISTETSSAVPFFFSSLLAMFLSPQMCVCVCVCKVLSFRPISRDLIFLNLR